MDGRQKKGPGKSPALLASPAGAGGGPAAAPGIAAPGRTAAGGVLLHADLLRGSGPALARYDPRSLHASGGGAIRTLPMGGMTFGELMRALAEPEPWPDRGICLAGQDEPPQLRSDCLEDTGPVTDPRLPEQPSAVIPRCVRALEHPPPLGSRR